MLHTGLRRGICCAKTGGMGLPMFGYTLLGTVHALVAMLGIGLGLVQFCRRKGDAVHRVVGYAYVGAMLLADAAALTVFQFTGKLNVLHVGAIANLICIGFGVWAVLRRPRRPSWRLRHYIWMSWSYVGLLAAAATELVVRTSPIANRAQGWVVTAIVALAATLVGYVLINRNRAVALQ